MNRFLTLSVAILLAAQADLTAGPVTSITVAGQLSDGSSVLAVCSVSNTGAITGTGVLSGTNPQNGYNYRYPFVITKGSTAQGSLVLNGNIGGPGGPSVTLTAAVPSGGVIFTYVVNGKAITLTGQGTVTVK